MRTDQEGMSLLKGCGISALVHRMLRKASLVLLDNPNFQEMLKIQIVIVIS